MSETRRIDDIEILRAFAILLVFIHHANSNLVYWSSPFLKEFKIFFGGGMGVDLFFAISGFVIARSLLPGLQQAESPRHFFQVTAAFWIRRFWRLTPSAWLWLFLPLALYFVFNDSGAFRTLKGNLTSVALALLNIANFHFAHVFGEAAYDNVVFVYWSLSLEEQFYLLLPFIVFFSRRKLPIVLGVLVVVQLLLNRSGSLDMLNMIRTDALFIGVLIAIWQQWDSYKDFKPSFLQHTSARFLFLIVFLFGLIMLGSKLEMIPRGYRHSVTTLLCGTAVLAASYHQNYIVRARWLKPFLMWVGSRSYTIYVTHIPVFAVTREIFYRLSPNLPVHKQSSFMIVMFVLTGVVLNACIAELNYRLLEIPLRNKGRRIADNYLHAKECATAGPEVIPNGV